MYAKVTAFVYLPLQIAAGVALSAPLATVAAALLKALLSLFSK